MGTENTIGANAVVCEDEDTLRRNKELFEYEMTEVKMMLAGKFKKVTAEDMNNAGRDVELNPGTVHLTGQMPSGEDIKVSGPKNLKNYDCSDVSISRETGADGENDKLSVVTADVHALKVSIPEKAEISQARAFALNAPKTGMAQKGETKIEVGAKAVVQKPTKRGSINRNAVVAAPIKAAVSVPDKKGLATKGVQNENHIAVAVSAVETSDKSKLDAKINTDVSCEKISVNTVKGKGVILAERTVDTTVTQVENNTNKKLNKNIAKCDVNASAPSEIAKTEIKRTDIKTDIIPVKVDSTYKSSMKADEIKTDVRSCHGIAINQSNIPNDTAISAGDINTTAIEDKVSGKRPPEVRIKGGEVKVKRGDTPYAPKRLDYTVVKNDVRVNSTASGVVLQSLDVNVTDVPVAEAGRIAVVTSRKLTVNEMNGGEVGVAAVSCPEKVSASSTVEGLNTVTVTVSSLSNAGLGDGIKRETVQNKVSISQTADAPTKNGSVNHTAPDFSVTTDGMKVTEIPSTDGIISELKSISEGCKKPAAMTFEEMCRRCDIKMPQIEYTSALSGVFEAFKAENSSNAE